HLANYQSAPNHVSRSYPQTCSQCHTQAGWLGAVFKHSASMTDCVSCHLANYQSAPNHLAKNYPQTCSQCHTQAGWSGAVFKHSASMTNCVSCHLADYQAAANHVAKNYPQTCSQCHNQSSWLGATFVHSAAMTNCASCHHSDFLAASTPINHTAQGIIESYCGTCHRSNGSPWQPTAFVHNSCYNSTTHRAHKGATCVQCHPGNYSTLSCTACHSNRQSCN
ncbi:MAG: cytochrome c3 family protein, partial [Elusimicrobiales bacterium]